MNLRFVSLVSLAVLGCVVAQAGSWSSPTYTGGNRTMSQTGSTLSYSLMNDGTYGGGGNTCGGAITATFKWNASSSSDLPPATVYVMETCSAGGTDMGNTGACGTADNGLSSGNNTKNTSSVVWYGPTYAQGSAKSVGTRLTKWDSSSGKVTVTASPSAAGDIWPSTVGSGLPMPGASVSYSAQITQRAVDIHRADGGSEQLIGGVMQGDTIYGWTGTDPLNFLYSAPGETDNPAHALLVGSFAPTASGMWSGVTPATGAPLGSLVVNPIGNMNVIPVTGQQPTLQGAPPTSSFLPVTWSFSVNDPTYGNIVGTYNWMLHAIQENWQDLSRKKDKVVGPAFDNIVLDDSNGVTYIVSYTHYIEKTTIWTVSAGVSLGSIIPVAKYYIGDPTISASYGESRTDTAGTTIGQEYVFTDGAGPGYYDVHTCYTKTVHSGLINVYTKLGCVNPDGSSATWCPVSEMGSNTLIVTLAQAGV